ncbi:MAG: MaoC family dehydratase [Acidimicrobiales bacterium]
MADVTKNYGQLMTLSVSYDDLPSKVGESLGTSEPIEISQERVNDFAECTGDHQWIHVDVERAKAGPFGGPIAHGFLTLSLAPVLVGSLLRVDGISMGVNYGLNKVRFVSPVPVGSKLSASGVLKEVTEISGGYQCVLEGTFQVEGAPKPACVADLVFRYYK